MNPEPTASPPASIEDRSRSRRLSIISIATAGSAWAAVLGHLTAEEAALMITGLAAISVGGTGWHIGIYCQTKQADPEFLVALRTSRLFQVVIGIVVAAVAAVTAVMSGAWMGTLTLVFSPLALLPFVGPKPPPEEVERRRAAARDLAIQAGAVAISALLAANFSSRLSLDLRQSGSLAIAAFLFGVALAMVTPGIRHLLPRSRS